MSYEVPHPEYEVPVSHPQYEVPVSPYANLYKQHGIYQRQPTYEGIKDAPIYEQLRAPMPLPSHITPYNPINGPGVRQPEFDDEPFPQPDIYGPRYKATSVGGRRRRTQRRQRKPYRKSSWSSKRRRTVKSRRR